MIGCANGPCPTLRGVGFSVAESVILQRFASVIAAANGGGWSAAGSGVSEGAGLCVLVTSEAAARPGAITGVVVLSG